MTAATSAQAASARTASAQVAPVVDPGDEVRSAAEALWTCRDPFLIGVRHHSPALAAAMPALLEAAAPDRLLVELPMELAPWLGWLAHPDTQAPVALSAVREDGGGLSFYPFADFSPELAAIRWAVRKGIPVEPCDLPWASSAWRGAGEGEPAGPVAVTDGEAGGGGDEAASEPDAALPSAPAVEGRELAGSMHRAAGVGDPEELWDRLVEVRAAGSDPERVRRAALALGWALRRSASVVGPVDLAREAWMRERIRAAHGRLAVVVGAFHAPALLPDVVGRAAPHVGATASTVVTSLIPYTFPLLDSRSGYPAGIRDPEWQQAAYESGLDAATVHQRAGELAVGIVAAMREAGHAAGTVDATELVRLASDLARLRGHAAPGRRELVEACAAVLSQGEPVGRGRAVARAMQQVLIGARHGRLAAGTPRSGLGPHVERLLAELRLPGPGDPRTELRLDPLRSDLDRRRHVALQRLVACGVAYGELTGSSGLGVETLTQVWSVGWQPATAALVDLAGIHGVTLEQAAEGALRSRLARAQSGEGGIGHELELVVVRAAAECGLIRLTEERIRALQVSFVRDGALAELIAALDELERIARGHVPGFPPPDALRVELLEVIAPELLAAAVRRLEAVRGSERQEDAAALAALVRRVDDGTSVGGSRIGWALGIIAREGSPLMQGAAEAVRVLTGRITVDAYGPLLGSWLDAAVDRAAHGVLSARFRGTVAVAAPFVESAGAILAALCDRVDALTDGAFVDRLPALRDGFDVLSTAARRRFLQAVITLRGLDAVADLTLEADPIAIARWAAADADGRAALVAAGFAVADESSAAVDDAGGAVSAQAAPGANGSISTLDRWRLILGQEQDQLEPDAGRIGATLDELYGAHGEGSREGIGDGDGGAGRGQGGFPTVREWSDELDSLFGTRVREEVLGRAAARGRSDVIEAIDPESITPSIELLEQVLSLAGSLPEARLGPLRRMVRRVVDALVEELAIRVRPALSGGVLPRATRRRTGRLHLARTVRANLATARETDAGTLTIVPERPYFHLRGRRSFDWRVVLVVDVSGSMEASTIYAAMMASIIAALPAVSTHFVAFADSVIDLSDRVDDPLGLLMEIRVGGGTDIAGALRYAKGLVTVPARTIVIVVSDFEEGGPTAPLIAEVRSLASGGSQLLGLAALDDRGAPRYEAGIAASLVDAGMPIAALTPLELARWVGERLRGA